MGLPSMGYTRIHGNFASENDAKSLGFNYTGSQTASQSQVAIRPLTKI